MTSKYFLGPMFFHKEQKIKANLSSETEQQQAWPLLENN